MKKTAFIFCILLSSCAGGGGSQKSLSTLYATHRANEQLIKSISIYQEMLDSWMAVPQLKNRGKPVFERQKDIVSACQNTYNKINDRILSLAAANGIKVKTKSVRMGFNDFQLVSLDAGDASIDFTERKTILHEMETLGNYILTHLFNYTARKRMSKFEGFIKRPTTQKNYPELESLFYSDQLIANEIMQLLLLPEKDEEGFITDETMFNSGSLIATLEELALLQQRILMACDKSLAALKNRLETPMLKMNFIDITVKEAGAYEKDSILLNVLPIAYDSTDMPLLRYTIDNNPTEYVGQTVKIPRTAKRVQGMICLYLYGEIVWKPWEYKIK